MQTDNIAHQGICHACARDWPVLLFEMHADRLAAVLGRICVEEEGLPGNLHIPVVTNENHEYLL